MGIKSLRYLRGGIILGQEFQKKQTQQFSTLKLLYHIVVKFHHEKHFHHEKELNVAGNSTAVSWVNAKKFYHEKALSYLHLLFLY